MDLTLPITTGGLAVIVVGFLAKKAWGWGAATLQEFRDHTQLDDERAFNTNLAHVELKGDVQLVCSKVDNLSEKLCERTERIDKMDNKLDTIIMRLPPK